MTSPALLVVVGLACLWGLRESLAGAGDVGAQPTSKAGDEVALKVVSNRYGQGIPYRAAADVNAESLPVVRSVLNDPAQKRSWSNAVVVLGVAGDPEDAERLTSFLRSPAEGKLSREEFAAKSSVPMALGYAVNRRPDANRKALEWLEESLKPRIWEERGVAWNAPFFDNDEDRDRHLTEQAILGLGLTGQPDARRALKSFKDSPEGRGYQGAIDTAVQTHKVVSSVGLMKYYESGSSSRRSGLPGD